MSGPCFLEFLALMVDVFGPSPEDDEVPWAADPVNEEDAINYYEHNSKIEEFYLYHYKNSQNQPWYLSTRRLVLKLIKMLRRRDLYDVPYDEPRQFTKARAQEYLDTMLFSSHNDTRFVQAFRMTKESFLEWAFQVKKFPQSIMIEVDDHCTLEVCLAVHVHVLGGIHQQAVATIFGISEEHVSEIFHSVCEMITRKRGQFIKMPSWDAPAPAILRQEENLTFEDAWGIIDNFHIIFTAKTLPTEEIRNQFYNVQKGALTISMMCICNLNHLRTGKFIYVSQPYPGGYGDSHTVRLELYNGLAQQIPPDKYLLADGGYPCCEWIVPTYHIHKTISENTPDHDRNEKNKAFNCKLSKIRALVEQHFSLLKIKFQLLKRENDFPAELQGSVIFSAFCLYNFLKDQSCDSFDEDFKELQATEEKFDGDFDNFKDPSARQSGMKAVSRSNGGSTPDKDYGQYVELFAPNTMQQGFMGRWKGRDGVGPFPQGHVPNNPFITERYLGAPLYADTNTMFSPWRFPATYSPSWVSVKTREINKKRREDLFAEYDELGEL